MFALRLLIEFKPPQSSFGRGAAAAADAIEASTASERNAACHRNARAQLNGIIILSYGFVRLNVFIEFT